MASRRAADQRADAVLGEELQQHAVRHAPVDDDDGLDAGFHHLDAALDLGDHAAGDGAVADHLARLRDRELGDELLVLVEHAGDVGQQQQALGLHAGGKRAGEGVGVDVERLPSRDTPTGAITGMRSDLEITSTMCGLTSTGSPT